MLISGALCWSVQVVAGMNPALIAGRVSLLFKGKNKPDFTVSLRGGEGLRAASQSWCRGGWGRL